MLFVCFVVVVVDVNIAVMQKLGQTLVHIYLLSGLN